MYHSQRSGELYAFATSADGRMHQWRLFAVAGNKVDAELVRRINIGTVAEGCVVDDETGHLYVSEETVAVWRYGAEPGDGEARTAVARIEDGGVLAVDLEGLAIYKTANGGGYLIVTSEGSDNYAVYDRKPPHSYRGSFWIRANAEAGLDGTSQTDGIEVTPVALPGFPRGMMVAQDGRYDESQNFKYVSWADIAAQLQLDDTTTTEPGKAE
jgi:3-phytase